MLYLTTFSFNLRFLTVITNAYFVKLSSLAEISPNHRKEPDTVDFVIQALPLALASSSILLPNRIRLASLREVPGLIREPLGLLRSHSLLFASVGRFLSTGFSTVQTGHWFRMPVSYPVPFGSSASASWRWFKVTMAQPHLRLRCP